MGKIYPNKFPWWEEKQEEEQEDKEEEQLDPVFTEGAQRVLHQRLESQTGHTDFQF